MIARLLTILTLSLPLAACAAAPAQETRAANAATPADAGQAQVSVPTPAQPPAQSPAAVAPSGQAAGERARSRAATAPAAPGASTGTSADNSPAASAAGTAPAAPLGSTPVQETPAVSPAPAPAIGAGTVTAPAPGPVTMPAGSATGSLLQTLFALIVVLAVLGGLAWFLKRYGPKAGGGSANLRIVGSLNLGGRERLLVVEVGNQWIVVGASPGRVNALATMPKQEGIEGTAALAQHAPSANSFADWLKQTIDKRK
jgi:flagellar biosynthetic protein FliO